MLCCLSYYALIAFSLIVIGYLANRLFFSGSSCKSRNRLDGKIVIITGANTGIGKETALDLAKRGARVILACRSLDLAQKVADQIILETNNNKVEVEILDLSDFKSIRDFSERIYKKYNRLDVLINNAGVMMCPYWKTKDGFEMQFGVNHLGHFLLTNLLLDLLKKSAPSRIVNVSSIAHQTGKINWDDLNSEKSYNPVIAYSQSKLANILFTNELAKRLEGTSVTAVSVHPGAVRTDLMRNVGDGIHRLVPIIVSIGYPLYWMISKSSYEGAQTSIHCAVDDSVPDHNGKYFSDCKPKETSKNAQDAEAAKKLWEISTQLVKL